MPTGKRRFGGKTKWRQRWNKGKLRKKKLDRLRRKLNKGKSRLLKIAMTGLKPAIGYGARVWGLSDNETLQARRMVLKSAPPFGQASLTCKLCLHGDPVWALWAGPLLAWSQEVWMALVSSSTYALRIGEMIGFWQQARPMDSRSFDDCTSPIQRMGYIVRKLEWSWPKPCVLVDADGVDIDLSLNSPSLVGWKVQRAVNQMHLRALQKKVLSAIPIEDGGLYGIYSSGVVQWEPIRNFIASRKYPAEVRGLVRKACCESLWTADKLSGCGYQIDPNCALCGLRRDTHFNRLWVCSDPQVVQARNAAVPQWFIRLARRAGEMHPFFSKAWVVVPKPPLPKEKAGWVAFDGDGGELDIGEFAVRGCVFTDGSCDCEPLSCLNRAGASACEVEREPPRRLVKVAYGLVWRSFPQTPQAAEHVGYAGAVQVAVDSATLCIDCASVVNAHALPYEQRLPHRGRSAGVARQVIACDSSKFIDECLKCQAHVEPASLEDPWLRFLAVGNGCADTYAKKGRALHPQLEDDDLNALQARLNHQRIVLRVMAAVLPLFPLAPSKLEKGQPLPRKPRPAYTGAAAHRWKLVLGRHHCAKCLASSLGTLEELPSGLCFPPLGIVRMCTANPCGHVLKVFDSCKGPFVMCGVCGSYAHRVPRALAKPCRGASRALESTGALYLQRVRDRKHPCCEEWAAPAVGAAGYRRLFVDPEAFRPLDLAARRAQRSASEALAHGPVRGVAQRAVSAGHQPRSSGVRATARPGVAPAAAAAALARLLANDRLEALPRRVLERGA